MAGQMGSMHISSSQAPSLLLRMFPNPRDQSAYRLISILPWSFPLTGSLGLAARQHAARAGGGYLALQSQRYLQGCQTQWEDAFKPTVYQTQGRLQKPPHTTAQHRWSQQKHYVGTRSRGVHCHGEECDSPGICTEPQHSILLFSNLFHPTITKNVTNINELNPMTILWGRSVLLSPIIDGETEAYPTSHNKSAAQ